MSELQKVCFCILLRNQLGANTLLYTTSIAAGVCAVYHAGACKGGC